MTSLWGVEFDEAVFVVEVADDGNVTEAAITEEGCSLRAEGFVDLNDTETARGEGQAVICSEISPGRYMIPKLLDHDAFQDSILANSARL